MKPNKHNQIQENLKVVIKHLIKEELTAKFSNTMLVPAMAHGFEEEGYDSYSTVQDALHGMGSSRDSKRLVRAVSELIDKEFFPALKEKLVKRIMDKLMSGFHE